jgi:hypothetical protein
MIGTLTAIQTEILQRLNAVYEENFHESVPAEEFCSAYSLSRQQLEVVLSPLVAEGWIEKDVETLGGYHLRFTYHGKRESDRRSGNRENERIRDLILDFLNEVYEQNVNAISSSDDLASKLGLNWNKVCLNLGILEREGSVELKALTQAGHAFYHVSLTPTGKFVHDNPVAKLIFLSHAAVDEGIAAHLKEVIEATLPGTSVFVSSDPEDLRPGDPWVDVILDNLRAAKLVLVLATQRGLSRKWVWYESGAGWSRGVRVVPCCVGKLRKGELPAPFSSFQALNIDEEDGYRRFINTVADEFALPHPEPLDVSAPVQSLKTADERILGSNVAYMSSEDIQHRLDSVELSVRINQGIAEYFMLLVENESSEEVEIEEIQLESKDGHRLADPARPKPSETWKMEAKGRLAINCQLQPDPSVQLLTLNGWPQSSFETDVRMRFLCVILTRQKWCSRVLRVQVDRGARRISQLVG